MHRVYRAISNWQSGFSTEHLLDLLATLRFKADILVSDHEVYSLIKNWTGASRAWAGHLFGLCTLNNSIRTTVLDIPVPMKAETVSRDFSVDYDALYTVWVKFDRSVSLHEAHCLLGGGKLEIDADQNCREFAPLLKFAWTLSRNGTGEATGLSDDLGSSLTENNSLNVSIFSFHAQKKHKYSLTLKFERDASSLNIPLPKVRVELDIFNREDFIWAGAVFDSLGFLLCVMGVAMFSVPLLKARFSQSKV